MPHGAANPNAPRYSRAKGAGDYIEKRQRRGRHHVLRAVLLVLVALVVASGVAVAAYVHHINTAITSGVDDKLRDTLVETKDPGDPFYMLLLGIDKDEGARRARTTARTTAHTAPTPSSWPAWTRATRRSR